MFISFETLLLSLNTVHVIVLRPTQHSPAIYLTVMPLPCKVPWLHSHLYFRLSPVATTLISVVSYHAFRTVSVAVRLRIFIAPVSGSLSSSLLHEINKLIENRVRIIKECRMNFNCFMVIRIKISISWILSGTYIGHSWFQHQCSLVNHHAPRLQYRQPGLQ